MAARKERPLHATDTESLQKLAAFRRLAWRSVHVRNADGSAEDDPIVLDVVATATLADVRVVLSLVVDAKTLWKKSRPMAFSFVKSLEECEPVPLSDEAHEPLSDFLHHGFVLYVQYARVLKPSPRSPRRALKPTFTASHQIGLYAADVDVYIDRVGLQIVLREIVETLSGRPMAALHALNDSVRLELDLADVADVCESSVDMISVLLTDGRQQPPIVQKVIERTVLTLDDEGQLHLGIGPMLPVGSQSPIVLRKPQSPRRKPPDERRPVELPPSTTTTPSEDDSETGDTITTSELCDMTMLVPAKHKIAREGPRDSAKRASLALTTPSTTLTVQRRASSRSGMGSTRALSVDGTPRGGSLRGMLVDDNDGSGKLTLMQDGTDDEKMSHEALLDMKRSSVSVAPIALELDRALVAALAYFAADDATPAMACMARDDLVLAFGMAEGSLLSKAGKSLLELREAFQRVMLLYLVAAPQSTTAAGAVKRYLWRGLGFCLWREVRDDVVSSCRFQTMKTLSVIRSHYKQRETYPGFKDKLPHYPSPVVGALECLRLVLHPSDVAWLDAANAVDPWTHVLALGLHTMAMFRKTLDKIEAHCRSRTLPARHRHEIGVRVAAWKLPEATDEALFGTLHLRKLILLVLEASDGSWHPSIKIDHCFTRALTGRESTGVALHIMELRDVVTQRLEPLVRENVIVDECRCAEVDAHCAVMVTDAWPPVPRWYMPRRHRKPHHVSRYFFVAERDAAFEMALAVHLIAPLPVVYSVSGDAMLSSKSLIELLTLALPLWSTSTTDSFLDATAMGGIRASCVGYGVNMLHASVLPRLKQWCLLDVFKVVGVDRIGVGSGVSPDGHVAMVLVRVFGALGKPPQTAPSDVAFVSHVMTATDVASVLDHGGLPMCKLLATQETTTSVLRVSTTSGIADATPTGPANDALERCLLAWTHADVGPSSFPLVMHYICTQEITGHATVKVLEALNGLLDAQDAYVAAVMTCVNDVIDANGCRHEGDMLQRLVDLAATPGLPVRITELAQKAVLGALLHHELGSPTKLLQYFGTLPDHLLGLPSRLPLESAGASDCILTKGPLLRHLSAAITICLTDATAMCSREPLECRFLSLLATPGGIEYVLQSAVATMGLVARCMHAATSARVVLHGARVIETLVAALALRGESALPDSHDQANVLQILVECILCRAQVATDFLQDAGRIVVGALATLLAVAPWHRWVLAALAPLLHDLAATQRIFWLDRVTGIATSGTPSPDATRFSAIVLAQHQSTARCQCAVLVSTTRHLVADVAARFVATVFANAGATMPTTTPTRVVAASIPRDGSRKILAANRIQKCALRWLYRHRKTHGFLPVLLRYATCAICATSPSLLAALVLLVCNTRSLALRTSPLDASPKLRLQALQCLTKLWFYPSLANAAVTDLHVDYVYLVLTSHDDIAWRSLALYGLSYLVWHAPIVLHSLLRTITQPLWPTLNASGPWLEVLLHTSLFAQRKTLLSNANIIAYVDCALHLLVVLSFEHKLAPLLTRTFGFTLRLLQMLNDAPVKGAGDAELHIRRLRDRLLPMALFVMANVLLRLGATEAFAFEIPCAEMALLLSAATPSVAQVQALHVLWALALRKQGRDSLRWSSALQVALVAALSARSGLASFESWAVVHGAAGVVACLAVDKDVCDDLCKLGLVEQLRDRLGDGASSSWSASCDVDMIKQASTFNNALEAAAGHAATTVQWNAKLAALGLLPLCGPGVPAAPSTLLRHQVLRSYTVCLVHKHRRELGPWLEAFPAGDAPILLRRSMCASLSLLARVDPALGSAVPSELLARLVQLAGSPDDGTVQRLAMQALGHLSLQTASVKEQVHSIDVVALLTTARPALQLEAISMLALAAKNSTVPLPPRLHQGTLARGLIRWLEQRDATRVWHRKSAAWSSVLLDSDDLVTNESRVTKCLRRPLELLLQCELDAADRPSVPLLLLSLLLETVTALPHLLHDTYVRDATALAVTLSLALSAGFEAASPWQPYCLTRPIVHGLAHILTQSLVVESPTLTLNVLSALQVAIAADEQLRLEVLSDVGFVQALVSMVGTSDAMQEPALQKTLELLESVLQRDRDPNGTFAPFLTHPKGPYTALTSVFAVSQEASLTLHAAALAVLGRLLEDPSYATYFLNGAFQTGGSRYKPYLERVLRCLALRAEWATGYRTRGVLLQQCAGAARLVAAITNASTVHDNALVALLLAKEGSYAATDAALDVLVQLFLDIGDSRFEGTPLSTAVLSELRVDITRALASLGRSETVRHTSALLHFVSVAAATPIDTERDAAVRANIVHIYEHLLCVPSVFRQLVFGHGVFMPRDDVANDAKPVFFFLGQQLALDSSMTYRPVYASMAGTLLTDAAFTLEMQFLEQHTIPSECLAAALTGSDAHRPLLRDAKELTRRLQCLEQGMPFGVDAPLSRHAGVRVVHELLRTVLHLWTTSFTRERTAIDGKNITAFLVQLLHWLHTRHPGSGLLVAPQMLQQCVDVIASVSPRALPLLLDLIAQLFRVAPLYKQTFLDMALTSALVHCLTPHSSTHLVPVLSFLWDLARNDASVALDLVDDATLLRQIFALLQLPIVYNPTFQCLALKRPSDAQLDVIIAATQVLCVVTSATRAALIVLHALELQLAKAAPTSSTEGMCPRSAPNTRPLLRTVLDLLAVSPSAELKQSLLALTQHFARATPSVTVARLCDHGGILVLFDCLFETTGAVQVMVLKLLQLLMDVSGPRGPDPAARHASISPRKSVLHSTGHSTTNMTRFSMAVSASSEVKRRTALRSAETGLRSLLTETNGPSPALESVALISARIALLGALYPIYDHRLNDMTLGNQTTEVDFAWIEDMLRRLVVFGQLSFAELHLVSRCMIIHRVLPSRSVITEPGLYVITTGKVAWHLDGAPFHPHVLEKGCMVGISSCVGGAPERATAMSGVVSLVLFKATIESALPSSIQQKLLGGMDRVRSMYASDRRPEKGTYLSRFKMSLLAPPLLGASSILLATMLHAVAATKEASRINPWLLVHLIHDIAQWHGPVPSDLVTSVVLVAAAVLSSQAHGATHQILLTLGRRHGAAGATFFASAFTKPIDDIIAPTDVLLCNALGQVLLALASYHCDPTAACSLGKHLCRCTLRARRALMQSLNMHWIDTVMTLFEEQPLLPRLDYCVLYRVLRKLFAVNNFQLASYLKYLSPRRLLHSFVGDVLNLAEDDAIEAQKLLLTLGRHPYFRNLVVCHDDVLDVASVWSLQQRAAIRSGSLPPLELLSCLCCATTPDAVPHRVAPIYQALVDDGSTLDVLAVNAADATMKRSLTALQCLRNLCVATARLDNAPSPTWDTSLGAHAALLPTLLSVVRIVPTTPFPFDHSSRLLVLAEVLLYACRRGLHLALNAFDLAHACVLQLQSLLDVPILGCVLENARTRLARVVGTILATPPPSLDTAQCHGLAYMLLETTLAAFSKRHEGLLRVLVRLLAFLPTCTWFRSLQTPPGTVDVAVAAVALVMEITLMPWDSIKHVSALCVAALCELPRVADVLTQDVYVAKICATLRSGCVGMQGFVSVLARLCETPTMRLRLLSYPACVASVEHILPLLHEHVCSIDAAYVLWTLWRTQRKTLGERLAIAQSTTDALLMLLQPSVPWLETAPEKRCHVAAGAFLELWRGADVPLTTWAGVLQRASAHVSRWTSHSAPPHQLLKLLSALLTDATLIAHVQRKRHLPWGALWTCVGAKDSYYLHLASFTTAFLRLEPSAPVRTHVQTLLCETPQFWSTCTPRLLHATNTFGILCILRLLYRACIGHRDNTIRVVSFWERCQRLVTDTVDTVEIADLVCRLWQLGFRTCPSAAQDEAVRLSFALYRQLHHTTIATTDARRVATRVCRTYTRLLRLALRLQPPPDVQSLLSPLLERRVSALTLAAVTLGAACARRSGTKTPTMAIDHLVLHLSQRVPHRVYWAWFIAAGRAATDPLETTDDDSWVTVVAHGRVLSHASTDVDIVFWYLHFSTAPDKMLQAAERVVATTSDHSERSWWLHVLRCCIMRYPSGTEQMCSFVVDIADVITDAVQSDAPPCVRDAAAALVSEMLACRQPSLAAYATSLLPSLLVTVTSALAHGSGDPTPTARLVSQLLDDSIEARAVLAPHLPRLLPVLCDRLLCALQHNHLQLAADLMQLVVGILYSHRCGYNSPADKMLLASATLQSCLELAIVKRPALVLVARSLCAARHLATVAPVLYVPYATLPRKWQSMVGQLLVQHIVTHTSSPPTPDAALFLDALAALLHPNMGSPEWLYEALARAGVIAQTLDRLPLLHGAPSSLASCLGILSHLLLVLKSTRDRAWLGRIAPFLKAPTRIVAAAALSVYWVLHRQDLSPKAVQRLLSVLDAVETPSEASYGLYAMLLAPPTLAIEGLWGTRGFLLHLDAIPRPVDRAEVRERAKFLSRLAVVDPDVVVAHLPSMAHLLQSLSVLCSKAAGYALQALRPLASSLDFAEILTAIQPHLWYGLTNAESLLHRGVDSCRKTQGTLAMLNVGHALDLAAACFDTLPSCLRHKRRIDGAAALLQLLLRLAHHGPWNRQALAMDLAARLFERVHCEMAFLDGTHRTLDALLECLHIPRLQAPGLHLLAVATTSPWVQAAVLASDGVLDCLLDRLRRNEHLAPLVWRILVHLAASGRQPLPLLSVLVAAHVWIDVRSYAIETHRDVARTMASLAKEPRCIPDILRLQTMLSGLRRDCDVDSALLETQLCIVASGGASHELSALTSVVMCLDAIFAYDHGACDALDKGLTAATVALTQLVASFYACATEHDDVPLVEASGSKLRPLVYVGCNGAPLSSPGIYVQLFRLWDLACSHPHRGVASVSWGAVLRMLLRIARASISGCFLVAEASTLHFVSSHLAKSTLDQCVDICDLLHAVVRVRAIAVQFARVSSSSPSLVHVLLAAAAHSLHGPRGTDPFVPTLPPLLTTLALLCEHPPFLQAPLLNDESALSSASLFSLLLYGVYHSMRRPWAYATLAAKLFVRFCTVHSLDTLNAEMARATSDLRGHGITKVHIAQTLLHAMYLTNFEFEMHLRVLVRVVHSVLVRMAALGRIDKGVPGLLHDHGLTNIFLLSKAYSDQYETRDDDWAMRSQWVHAMKEEHVKYCVDGYEALYTALESANRDPQLIVAIESTRHATMCLQTLHYVLQLLHEACVASSPTAASDVHLFFQRIEHIGEWVILCLESPDMDVGYYTNQIEALCRSVRHLLSSHKSHAFDPSSTPTTDMTYPVSIELRHVHLHSWVWALLGSRPYVRLGVGKKHAYYSCVSGRLPATCPHQHYRCGDYDVTDGRLVVDADDALQSLDIQLWMYLPWSPVDICIGRATAGFPMPPTASIDFYPEQRDKMRFDVVQPYGHIAVVVAPTTSMDELNSSAFPYSTCGSKSLRQRLTRGFLWLASSLRSLGRRWLWPAHSQGRVVAVGSAKHRGAADMSDAAAQLLLHWTDLQLVLERMTSKEKLIGSYEKQYAIDECKHVAELLLGSGAGSFDALQPHMLASLTNPTHHAIWHRTSYAIRRAIELHMPRGLTFLKTHLHAHVSAISGARHVPLLEVCNGIPGLDDDVAPRPVAPAMPTTVMRTAGRFLLHGLLRAAVTPTTESGASIRRRHLPGRNCILPIQSIFAQPEALAHAAPQYERQCAVAPETLNHFLLQPIERLQTLLVVSKLTDACFGHAHLARVSIPEPAAVSRDLLQSTARLATVLHRAWRQALASAPGSSPSLSLVPTAVTPHARSSTSTLLKHMATLKRGQILAPTGTTLYEIEAKRKLTLALYRDVDPFDAHSKLKALNARAKKMAWFLYRDGWVADVIHGVAWTILAVTVWRLVATRDALREASRTYRGLLAQSSGLLQRRGAVGKTRRRKKTAEAIDVASGDDYPSDLAVLRSEKELRYFLVVSELQGIFLDLLFIWPSENGKIGLGDFWSSLLYTALALGLPLLFYYVLTPVIADASLLSLLACWLGVGWVLLTLSSIVSVTTTIQGFNDTRRVDAINLTDFPACLKNYLAIVSILWELVQLNTIPWQVWDASYVVHQIAALVTIDINFSGYFVAQFEFNAFLIKQRFAVACLVLWFFSLKAANKFKGMNWLNYVVTFLLPSLLSSVLFMFLVEQYIYAMACYKLSTPDTTTYVLWSNPAIVCWTPTHWQYAMVGMFGMGLFIPLAVLSHGSHQLAFPQLDLDIQTSPLFAMVGQLVKGLMIGAKTFFATNVRFYLGISILGDLVLLVSHYRFRRACSTWHVRAAKLVVYALSLWSAVCAMLSTYLDRDTVPLFIMYAGHAAMLLVLLAVVRYRIHWLYDTPSLFDDTKTTAG
ncbi:hypothetical protein SDRG_10849 [Saprolegnia diclina VS20]|uniref:Uncharacterized protein n=1 Tax=Saprolegnia diclina (strain VS20) TaxID=1156394 RepID=T0QAI3_SAPDV|nr:hypothetical protein SDRG_10849 [Saprolegnia diclina VS20]EQC31686.1 hypothetical protein SDRG_10849 [Saprolegnia diclina VS20]|eukprot:XP_008615085.1 hypothetical protein SDRG_10849 [Saprolegnia diclina VS20]